tara:strand:+ start:2265 stop:2750 length:486 start_codon:yes stop_codon:yes gene_type:complete
MISQKQLLDLYEWGMNTKFPLKKAPTTKGYTNKDIFICGLKFVRKNTNIRKNLMNDTVYDILNNDDILYATYTIFQGGTVLTPHLDPNVYRDKYKRVQIPLRIPEKNKCYMTWIDRNKIYWESGVTQVFPVMDYVHEGHNLSDKPMDFIFLDVKINTEVEI